MEHAAESYRKKAAPRALVTRILREQQARLYAHYARAFPPRRGQRVLDLGVTASLTDRDGYFFESRYPYLEDVVAAGIEPGDGLAACFPSIRYERLARDGDLPFDDGELDVVFCNAVIEHVGSRERQRRFLEEIFRVGRAAFVTTPNRWYPVELHTMLPLLHYLPTSTYRSIYRRLGFDFFASEEHLNLLDARTLAALVPPHAQIEIAHHHFLGLPSNLLLVHRRRER